MPISKWQKFNALRMPLPQWKEAVETTSAKAEAGDAQAQWELGSLLDSGLLDTRGEAWIVRPNKRAAARWFRRSAEAGDPSGQVCLGNYLSAAGDDHQAMIWYRRAARQGDSSGASNIAQMYANRSKQRRAFSWYQRAAAMKDGDALVETGVRYYEGNGVGRDPKSAVRCFRKAIQSTTGHITQAGRERAMFWLGRAYYEGSGVKRSVAKALEWLLKANVDDDIAEARHMIEEIRGHLRKANPRRRGSGFGAH